MTRPARCARILLLLVSALPLVPQLTLANAFKTHRWPAADSQDHWIQYWNLTDAYKYASNSALLYKLEPTNVNVEWDHGSWLDVRTVDGNWGDTGWLGWEECVDYRSDEVCSESKVRFNLYHPTTASHRRYIACHEFGHSVGLGHERYNTHGNSCMISGSGFESYTSHDVSHINGYY